MKRITAILASTALWFGLGMFCGHYIGSRGGYARGVRDIAELVIIMRDVDRPPAPFTSGAI